MTVEQFKKAEELNKKILSYEYQLKEVDEFLKSKVTSVRFELSYQTEKEGLISSAAKMTGQLNNINEDIIHLSTVFLSLYKEKLLLRLEVLRESLKNI